MGCGTPHEAGEKFCGECGAVLAATAAASATAVSAAKPSVPGIRVTAEQEDASTSFDGERNTVTALPSGSSTPTRLNATGPEGARGLFHRLLASFLSGGLIETPNADSPP
jgi:hypothetical protein